MTRVSALLLAALLTTAWPSRAPAAGRYVPQASDPVSEAWRWFPLTDLVGRATHCMAIDDAGNLWFGRDDGVWRYDGLRWTVYGAGDGLDETSVNALAMASGEVYAGTQRGVYRLEGARWNRVFPPSGDQPMLVSRVAADGRGDIWVGTAWGVARVGPEGASLYTAPRIVPALQDALRGVRVLPIASDVLRPETVAYGSLGIQRSDDLVTWVIPGSPAERAGIRAGDRVVARASIADAASGVERLAIAREGNAGTLEFDVTPAAGSGPVVEIGVHDVCPMRDGSVWISLDDGEVLRLEVEPNRWTRFSESDGLDLGGPQRIMQARDGTVWTVSDDRTSGLNRFDGVRWTTTRLTDLGGIDVGLALLQTSDGVIWVGGHEGYLHAWRDGSWTVYHAPDVPVPETRITGLAEGADGALWILAQGKRPTRVDYRTDLWSTYEGLNYQCDDTAGRSWFLSVDDGVVRHDANGWTRFDREDGVADTPVGIVSDGVGGVWVVGSHRATAALARWDGAAWELRLFPALSWGIDGRAAMVDRDGSLWVGAAVDWFAERGHRGGVMHVDGIAVTHDPAPGILRYVYGMGQTGDGRIWIGSYRGLHVYDGRTWARVEAPEAMRLGVNAIATSPKGELWIGHRTHGAFRYDGNAWVNFDTGAGLEDNTVRSIAATADGTVWVATSRGIGRYDGRTWTSPALPFTPDIGLRGSLRQSSDGSVWINTATEAWHRRAWPQEARPRDHLDVFRTVRHRPEEAPPVTRILIAELEVSQPGNTTIVWEAVDPWHLTPSDELQFAWKLDEGPWTPYARTTSAILQALPSGPHVFSVKARDRDFNEDPTPAIAEFTVVPPVWRQPWFLALIFSLVTIGAVQTARVVRRGRRLSRANTKLADTNAELAASNRELHETREQMILQEKMAALGGLVAGIAHEINTPIGAFNSAADLMHRCIARISELVEKSPSIEHLKANPALARAVGALEASATTATTAGARVAAIVQSLRRFARLDESDYQRADLHNGIDSTLALCTTDLGERITIEKDYGDLPAVLCYPGELNQVFLNLVANAIQAIRDRGKIRIQTRHQDGQVTIRITDTGHGITKDVLPRIFDPGFTTRGVGVGVGLGLAISYRIVQKHGGTLDAESEPGRGSTFTIRLPVTPPPSGT